MSAVFDLICLLCLHELCGWASRAGSGVEAWAAGRAGPRHKVMCQTDFHRRSNERNNVTQMDTRSSLDELRRASLEEWVRIAKLRCALRFRRSLSRFLRELFSQTSYRDSVFFHQPIHSQAGKWYYFEDKRLLTQRRRLFEFVVAEFQKGKYDGFPYDPFTLFDIKKVNQLIRATQFQPHTEGHPLYVSKSKIVHGSVGVFARKGIKIKEGSKLLFYPGVLMTEEQHDRLSKEICVPTGFKAEWMNYRPKPHAKDQVQVVIIGDPCALGPILNSPYQTQYAFNAKFERADNLTGFIRATSNYSQEDLDTVLKKTGSFQARGGKDANLPKCKEISVIYDSTITVTATNLIDAERDAIEILTTYTTLEEETNRSRNQGSDENVRQSNPSGLNPFWDVSYMDHYCDVCYRHTVGTGMVLCGKEDDKEEDKEDCYCARHKDCFDQGTAPAKEDSHFCAVHLQQQNRSLGLVSVIAGISPVLEPQSTSSQPPPLAVATPPPAPAIAPPPKARKILPPVPHFRDSMRARTPSPTPMEIDSAEALPSPMATRLLTPFSASSIKTASSPTPTWSSATNERDQIETSIYPEIHSSLSKQLKGTTAQSILLSNTSQDPTAWSTNWLKFVRAFDQTIQERLGSLVRIHFLQHKALKQYCLSLARIRNAFPYNSCLDYRFGGVKPASPYPSLITKPSIALPGFLGVYTVSDLKADDILGLYSPSSLIRHSHFVGMPFVINTALSANIQCPERKEEILLVGDPFFSVLSQVNHMHSKGANVAFTSGAAAESFAETRSGKYDHPYVSQDTVKFRATRKIKADTELLLNYRYGRSLQVRKLCVVCILAEDVTEIYPGLKEALGRFISCSHAANCSFGFHEKCMPGQSLEQPQTYACFVHVNENDPAMSHSTQASSVNVLGKPRSVPCSLNVRMDDCGQQNESAETYDESDQLTADNEDEQIVQPAAKTRARELVQPAEGGDSEDDVPNSSDSSYVDAEEESDSDAGSAFESDSGADPGADPVVIRLNNNRHSCPDPPLSRASSIGGTIASIRRTPSEKKKFEPGTQMAREFVVIKSEWTKKKPKQTDEEFQKMLEAYFNVELDHEDKKPIGKGKKVMKSYGAAHDAHLECPKGCANRKTALIDACKQEYTDGEQREQQIKRIEESFSVISNATQMYKASFPFRNKFHGRDKMYDAIFTQLRANPTFVWNDHVLLCANCLCGVLKISQSTFTKQKSRFYSREEKASNAKPAPPVQSQNMELTECFNTHIPFAKRNKMTQVAERFRRFSIDYHQECPTKERILQIPGGRQYYRRTLPFLSFDAMLDTFRTYLSNKKYRGKLGSLGFSSTTLRRAMTALEEMYACRFAYQQTVALLKCSECDRFDRQIKEAITQGNKEAEQAAIRGKQNHLAEMLEQRQSYDYCKEIADAEPWEMNVISLDGMEQSDTSLPHLYQRTKDVQSNFALRIMGAISYGTPFRALAFGLTPDTLSKGAAPSLTCFYRAIEVFYNEMKGEEKEDSEPEPAPEPEPAEKLPFVWPRKILVVSDNASGDFKNIETLLGIAILVGIGMYETAILQTLLKGHTHDVVDAMFGVFARRCGEADAFTPDEMLNLLRDSYTAREVKKGEVPDNGAEPDYKFMKAALDRNPHPYMEHLRHIYEVSSIPILSDPRIKSKFAGISSHHLFMMRVENITVDETKTLPADVDPAGGLHVVMYFKHLVKSHITETEYIHSFAKEETGGPYVSRLVLFSCKRALTQSDPLISLPIKYDFNQLTSQLSKVNLNEKQKAEWDVLMESSRKTQEEAVGEGSKCPTCKRLAIDLAEIGVIRSTDKDKADKEKRRSDLQTLLHNHLAETRDDACHLHLRGRGNLALMTTLRERARRIRRYYQDRAEKGIQVWPKESKFPALLAELDELDKKLQNGDVPQMDLPVAAQRAANYGRSAHPGVRSIPGITHAKNLRTDEGCFLDKCRKGEQGRVPRVGDIALIRSGNPGYCVYFGQIDKVKIHPSVLKNKENCAQEGQDRNDEMEVDELAQDDPPPSRSMPSPRPASRRRGRARLQPKPAAAAEAAAAMESDDSADPSQDDPQPIASRSRPRRACTRVSQPKPAAAAAAESDELEEEEEEEEEASLSSQSESDQEFAARENKKRGKLFGSPDHESESENPLDENASMGEIFLKTTLTVTYYEYEEGGLLADGKTRYSSAVDSWTAFVEKCCTLREKAQWEAAVAGRAEAEPKFLPIPPIVVQQLFGQHFLLDKKQSNNDVSLTSVLGWLPKKDAFRADRRLNAKAACLCLRDQCEIMPDTAQAIVSKRLQTGHVPLGAPSRVRIALDEGAAAAAAGPPAGEASAGPQRGSEDSNKPAKKRRRK